jgi:hypothetical protein
VRTAYTDAVARRFWCCTPGCRGQSDPHHVRGKGAAGQVDEGNVAPLCRTHHEELHAVGRHTFARRHRVCLPGEALKVLAALLRRPPVDPDLEY